MKFESLDGGEDGDHDGFRFVEISKIFEAQESFCFRNWPFDRVQR